MLQFFKDSIRELKHVVWPTRKETQKYFLLVLAMLVFFGFYLFVFSNIFSELIFGLKGAFTPEASVSISDTTTLPTHDADAAMVSDEATPLEVVSIETTSTGETSTGTTE